MSEYIYELKIPKQRIAVLVGTQGEVKNRIEEATQTKIKIDSREGDVFVSGEDNIKLFSCQLIIKAIARGFNPDKAMLLLKTDYAFEMINISDYAKTQADIIRLRGRVIGKQGKSRKTIEDITNCYISVFGKTISLIGSVENVPLTLRAVEKLLKGSTHSKVYNWLERKKSEFKEALNSIKKEENE